jgi:hypothetical protein
MNTFQRTSGTIQRGAALFLVIFTTYRLFNFVSAQLISDEQIALATPSPELCKMDQDSIPSLPDGNYLYNKQYGWFDANHFGSGNPAKIISDTRTAAARGGGILTVSQGVRNGLTGYSAYYLLGGGIQEGDVIPVALGIYLDWSVRFEEWQGQPPRSLVGPLTAFAIEDLPSHYVSFFAVAHDLEVAQVFACYLGPVQADNGPPHFVFFEKSSGYDEEALPLPVQQLFNRGFTPLILTDEGWQYVPWPPAIQMTSIGSDSGYWLFEGEETWYFDWP